MTDWKSIAQKRLRTIRDMRQAREQLRCDIYNAVRRELAKALHANCITHADDLAADIANRVAVRLTTP